MDSKIILAILIVALIGVVAATYNNEATDAIQTLTSVATEEDSPDGATDILDSNLGENSENSLKIDEDVVKPDNDATKKANGKQVQNTNSKKPYSNSNGGSSTQNTNKPTSTANTTVTQSTNTNSGNQTINTTNHKISSNRAKEIATNKLPSEYSKAVASNPTINGKYYDVTFYMDGKAVGYYEIDADTGAITGGAFKNEVPDPNN